MLVIYLLVLYNKITVGSKEFISMDCNNSKAHFDTPCKTGVNIGVHITVGEMSMQNFTT